MRSRKLTSIAAGAIVAAATIACEPSYFEIPIETPIRPKLDISAFKRVLIAGFVSGGNEEVDANQETARLLRSQLRTKSSLKVIDADILPLTEIAQTQSKAAAEPRDGDTGGPQPLWRPRYIRALRTGGADAASLDEAAVAEIAAVLAIVGGTPSRVSGFAPRVDDESGAADVAMLTVVFEGGPLARIDVSLVEPWPRRRHPSRAAPWRETGRSPECGRRGCAPTPRRARARG